MLLNIAYSSVHTAHVYILLIYLFFKMYYYYHPHDMCKGPVGDASGVYCVHY